MNIILIIWYFLKNLLLSRKRNQPRELQKRKNTTDDVIDPIPPEEVSPPPPVLPFESSPPSDPNDMDIDDIEDAALEFHSTEETSKRGKKASDGVIDPEAPITDSPPSPVLLVESSPHADPKVIDIDDIQNSALPDTYATFDDTQTSPHDSPPPKVGLDASQPSSAFPEDKYPDVTAGPVFSLGHDDASYILDNA